MLQPLETFKKYYLLRKTLQTVLSAPMTGVDVGVIAYGHRRKTACDDVEQISGIEPFDAGRFARAFFSVRPKGQSPVAEALKQAATALGQAAAASGKILLIAGAGDTCQQDPCAIATDLATANPQLSIDVLGIGLNETDAKQFSCVALAARGRMILATSMEDTEPALREALARMTSAPLPMVATPTKALAPDESPGLHLSARLSEGSAALARPVAWTVRKAPEGDQPGAIVFRAGTPLSRVELPPGHYEVESAAGLVTRHQGVEITAGTPANLVVTLNAGNLALKPQLGRPEDKPSDSTFTVYRVDTDPDLPLETVALVRGPTQPLLLPAGQYHVVGERGSVRVERDVNITAGETVTPDFAIATGTLQIDAPLTADAGPTAGTIYFISEDDPDQPLGQRDVARSAMINPSFELPSGAYHVLARQGSTQTRIDAIVKAGESTRIALPIATGRLRVTTGGLAGAGDLPEDLISYVVERLDAAGNAQAVVARSSQKDPTLELEAGPYRVTGKVGLVNISTSADVVIKPGAETRIELQQRAALMALRFGDGTANATDVLWEILSPDGSVLWSTVGQAPVVPLAPGDYEIRVSRSGREQTAKVILEANDRKTVDIRPE